MTSPALLEDSLMVDDAGKPMRTEVETYLRVVDEGDEPDEMFLGADFRLKAESRNSGGTDDSLMRRWWSYRRCLRISHSRHIRFPFRVKEFLMDVSLDRSWTDPGSKDMRVAMMLFRDLKQDDRSYKLVPGSLAVFLGTRRKRSLLVGDAPGRKTAGDAAGGAASRAMFVADIDDDVSTLRVPCSERVFPAGQYSLGLFTQADIPLCINTSDMKESEEFWPRYRRVGGLSTPLPNDKDLIVALRKYKKVTTVRLAEKGIREGIGMRAEQFPRVQLLLEPADVENVAEMIERVEFLAERLAPDAASVYGCWVRVVVSSAAAAGSKKKKSAGVISLCACRSLMHLL